MVRATACGLWPWGCSLRKLGRLAHPWEQPSLRLHPDRKPARHTDIVLSQGMVGRNLGLLPV